MPPHARSTSLTDTQLVILSRASQRDDRRIIVPAHLRGGAADRVLKSLLAQGLIVPAAVQDNTGLRDPEVSGPRYVIADAGLAALGLSDAIEGESGAIADPDALEPAGRAAEGGADPGSSRPELKAGGMSAPLPGGSGKQAQVLRLLGRPDGVCIGVLTTATGWQKHTVRAVLSGFRKRGLPIARERGGDGISRYRLTQAREAAPHAAEPAPLADDQR